MTAKIARPFVDSIFITLIVSMFITEGEGGVKSLETRPVRTAGGHSDTHPRNKKSRLGRLEISELRSSACVNGNCGIACDRVEDSAAEQAREITFSFGGTRDRDNLENAERDANVPGKKGFPRGHRALVNEGFVYLTAGACPDCRASVLWYKTPRGKRMPIDAAKNLPHWWVCAAFEDGSRRRGPIQLDLFPASSAPGK